MIKRRPAALGRWGGVIMMLPVGVFAAPERRHYTARGWYGRLSRCGS